MCYYSFSSNLLFLTVCDPTGSDRNGASNGRFAATKGTGHGLAHIGTRRGELTPVFVYLGGIWARSFRASAASPKFGMFSAASSSFRASPFRPSL